MEIELDNIAIAYNQQAVIENLSLQIKQREIFALLGSNGAGKSSTVKALLDFTDITQGHIRIRDINHRQTSARANLAYVPEKFSPPYYYTGLQFIKFTLAAHQTDFDQSRVDAYCKQLNMPPQTLRHPIKTYSKGMCQKLGLIAALASNKPLLILDEPMSGLDPAARARLRQLFAALKEEGRTLFLCTHMLQDVESICDRIGILHNGQLCFVGTPEACKAQFNAGSLDQAFLKATRFVEA